MTQYLLSEEKNTSSSEIPSIPKEIIKDMKQLALNGSVEAIIEDLRPFFFTERQGMISYSKACKEIGMKLGQLPSDDQIKQIIPKKDANTKKIKELWVTEEKEMRKYCGIANGRRLPQNHLAFDLWEDKGKKHKYLCHVSYILHSLSKRCFSTSQSLWMLCT